MDPSPTHAARAQLSTRIFKIASTERALWAAEIAKLEAGARYPLGADHFRLDHGKDYFAFFDRLGDVAYYVAVTDGEVVAVGCGMLRTLPFTLGVQPAWYIGDLKVRPDHRGQHIPLRMMAAAFAPEYARCPRGYGISMNPARGDNRVVRLIARFPIAPMRLAATLDIFSLDGPQARAAMPAIAHHRGSTHFLSLSGIKEIVLESSGCTLPLLHAQFGPLADPAAHHRPTDGATHMLCAPRGDALALALAEQGFQATASASVIALRMGDYDWRNILTSEI